MKISINRIRINKYCLVWSLIIAELLLLFCRDFAGMQITKYAFIILTTGALLLSDKKRMYEIIAFLIPLFAGMPGTLISCIALLIVLGKSFKSKIKIDSKGLVFCLAILIIELLSAFRGYFGIADYIRFAGPFLLTFLFIFDRSEEYDNYKISRNYILGLVIAVVDVVGQMIIRYGISIVLIMDVRIGDIASLSGETSEGMSFAYNSNQLGIMCAVAAMMCLILIIRYKIKYYILPVVLFLMVGTMTQSRTFLVVLLLGIIMFIILGNDSPGKAIKKVLILLTGISVSLLLIIKLLPKYLQTFISRFKEADIFNGRGEITSSYWQEFFNHIDRWPIGVGLQNYSEKYGIFASVHFGMQEVTVTWGIIGLILVILILIRMFRLLDYKKRSDYIMIIPPAMMLVGIQSGQFFSNTVTLLSFIALFAFANIRREKTDNVNKLPETEN